MPDRDQNTYTDENLSSPPEERDIMGSGEPRYNAGTMNPAGDMNRGRDVDDRDVSPSPSRSGLAGAGSDTTPEDLDEGGYGGRDISRDRGTPDQSSGGLAGSDSDDAETELLQPGYDPQIADAGRAGEGRTRTVVPPGGYSGSEGRPGMPDQTGQLDQTTYTSQDDPGLSGSSGPTGDYGS
jgi:hypothetical protein